MSARRQPPTLADRRRVIRRLVATLHGCAQNHVRIEHVWSGDGRGDSLIGMRVTVDRREAFEEGDAGTYCTEARGLYLLERAVRRRCRAVQTALADVTRQRAEARRRG